MHEFDTSGGATLRALRWILTLLVAFSTARLRADERVSQVTLERAHVGVVVSTTWPSGLNKGYQPLSVVLVNDSDTRARVEVEAGQDAWSIRMEAVQQAVIEPFSTVRLELLVPCFHNQSPEPTISVTVKSGSESRYVHLAGSSSGSPDQVLGVLAFSSTPPVAGGDATRSVGLGAAGATAGATQPTIQLSTAPWPSAQERWAAYTSLDAVVIDASSELPADFGRVVAPLLQWVRAGGKLLVMGAGGRAALEQLESLDGALEDRFAIPVTHGTAWKHGLGILQIAETDWSSADWLPPLREVLGGVPSARSRPEWVPSHGSYVDMPRRGIPGVGDLPMRLFLFVLLAFGLAIGPLNVIFVNSTRRPALLLTTTPLLSLATAALVLAYGVFHQGIDVKASSTSLSWLDQRTARVSTVELRALFAGLSAGALQPGPGSAVFPMVEYDGSTPAYTITHQGAALRLVGSFLPVREEVCQLVITEAAARAGVRIRPDGDAYAANSEFSVPIRRLWLRTEDGRIFANEGASPIEPGAEVRLAAGTFEAELPFANANVVVPNGAYVAELVDNPFLDDLGIEVNRLANSHYVIGVLPAKEADWR